MKERLKKIMLKESIIVQVLILVVILILPINVISIAYTWLAQDAYTVQIQKSIEHSVELYFSTVSTRIEGTDYYLTSNIDSNPYAVSLWEKVDEENILPAYFLWQELNEHCNYHMDADGYFFYNKEIGNSFVAVYRDYSAYQKKISKYFSENCDESIPKTWYLENIEGEKWLIHCINRKNLYMGAMLNVSKMEQELNAALDSEIVRVSIEEKDVLKNNEEGIGLEGTTIQAVIAFMEMKLHSNMPPIYQIGIILAILFLLSIPILVLALRKVMIRPIARLDHAMEELEKGNLDYRILEDGINIETYRLQKRYNSMAQQLKTLKIETYEKELQKMEIEALNLRLQVNPHFLLNSLNIIFSMAKTGNLKEIKTFTKYLADYVRFSLWHTSGKIKIKKEIDGVRNYLEIQKMRFPKMFTFLFDVQECVDELEIPSLLILNFVENAIKYALNMEREIEILVIVRKNENMLNISICDTGNGMTEECTRILQRGEILEDEKGKHIGVWNCIRRMKMMYGEKAKLHINSKMGEGTQIFIELPIAEGELAAKEKREEKE